MCYDVETQLRRQLKDARAAGAPTEEIDFLQNRIDRFVDEHGQDELSKHEHFWTMGFQHRQLPVITADTFDELQFFQWGLIPFWVKDEATASKLANNCLNARSETMFEKPSFRAASKQRRCVIPVSGYYEHHWVDSKGKSKVPYYIKHKDDRTLYLAGLWEEWNNPSTGEVINTCTIATTRANETLSKIHNRKPEDPRMLVILDFEEIAQWLAPVEDKVDIDVIKELCQAYPDELLESYTVPQLRGKNAVGDVPEASKHSQYPYIGLP